MHTYVLIPLLASIGAFAMMSAILARDPNSRTSRLAAKILACAAIWSLCDLIAHVGFGAQVATGLFRVACGFVLLFPVLGLQLMLESDSVSKRRFRGALMLAWSTSLAVSLLSTLSSGFITGVVWSSWGWRAELGDLYWLGIPPSILCIATAYRCFQSRNLGFTEFDANGRRGQTLVATILLLAIPTSEIIAPYLEIPSPRLGSLSVILLAVMLWVLSIRSGEYLPPPSAFAREVLDGLEDGVALINREGRIRVANEALAGLVGMPVDDLRGLRVSELLEASMESLAARGSDAETALRVFYGESIPVSATTSELRDNSGSILGSVLVVRDHREVTQLRRRVVTAGRLAAVGELAAGIAHEVNNPIAFIQSNLHSLHKNDAAMMDLLQNELPADAVPDSISEGHHLVGQSLQCISRVSAIVKEVRGFSHMGPREFQSDDINKLMESAFRIAIPRLRHTAKVTRSYGSLELVRCAGQDLKQVFLDLILNAVRSLGGNGTIQLHTSMRGDDVLVVVEDDGLGLSEAQQNRIFDPAFGGEARGAGPDLCVAYQIVRQHAGEIEIDSEIGRGTKVTLRLPCAGPLGSEPTDKGETHQMAGGEAS
jgi:PAS domain S-box-containing protein